MLKAVVITLWMTTASGRGSAGAASPAKVPDPVAWQAALDRAGYSPGVIDGTMGEKTAAALAAFQASLDQPATGRPDAATRRALAVDEMPAVARYVLTDADLEAVGPWPKSWPAKAAADRLGYASLASLAAERGHCTRRLLARLNPTLKLDRLSVGDSLLLPNVAPPEGRVRAARVEIDLTARRVCALDTKGRIVGLFHCSIARDKEKRPNGSARVTSVTKNPAYWFDPAMWTEVKGVDRKLRIPPGPRNPVGLCWIGLNLPGYGIHGTPEPELIGKTGSHGCFRLTNWDALRLGGMLRVGTPVGFVESSTWLAGRTQERRPSRRK